MKANSKKCVYKTQHATKPIYIAYNPTRNQARMGVARSPAPARSQSSRPGVVGGGEEDRIRLLYKLMLINKYDISTLFSSWRYNTSNQVCTCQSSRFAHTRTFAGLIFNLYTAARGSLRNLLPNPSCPPSSSFFSSSSWIRSSN